MKICGIYELKCKSDGKFLIGSSNHIMRRYYQHLWDLRRNIHHNPHLQNAFCLYGEPNFEIKVLEECSEGDLLIREDWWIFNRNALDPKCGFNFKPAFRPVHSRETCKKISDSKMGDKNPMYGKKISDEHKKKISESSKIHMLGRHPSIQTRFRMSISQTGKKLSEETKKKIGEASKIRVFSAVSRLKMSERQKGDKSPMFGKKQSSETILKRSISMQATMNQKRFEREAAGIARVFGIAFKVNSSDKQIIKEVKELHPEFDLYTSFHNLLKEEQECPSLLLNDKYLHEKENAKDKNCMIQIRISLIDKQIIEGFKNSNPSLKLSKFFRSILKVIIRQSQVEVED